VPTWRLTQKKDQVVRLIQFYRDYPDERKGIGTSAGLLKVSRLGLLNVATPTTPELPDDVRSTDVDQTIRTALEELSQASGSFAIFTADRRRGYYVQALLNRDGELYLEAVSNWNLALTDQLREQDVDRLSRMGWMLIPGADNFAQTVSLEADGALDGAALLIRRTLEDVYGLPANRRPVVKRGRDAIAPDEMSALEGWLAFLTVVPVYWEAQAYDMGEQEGAFLLLLPTIVGAGIGLFAAFVAGETIGILVWVASFLALSLYMVLSAMALALVVTKTRPQTILRGLGLTVVAIGAYLLPAASTLAIASAL
jgi:hypothetical protein